MNSIAQLAVPREIRKSFAFTPQTISVETPETVARLHCNETPFDLPEALKQQLTAKMASLAWNHYPDFHNTALKTLIAQQANVTSENILLGNGSSQLIQQIVSCFSKVFSTAILESPTFTFYHQVCQNERMSYKEWVLSPNTGFDLASFPQVTEPALVVLTSPNNPTGATLPLAHLQTLLEKHPECVFVVDEAYGDFGGETALSLVQRYANLLVLRTFSKGYGLPSVRFGYAAGNAALIQLVKKYTIPFTVNCFTEVIVSEALSNTEFIEFQQANIQRINNLRDFVYQLIDEVATPHTFSVQPSSANFLLLRFHDEDLYNNLKFALQANRILVAYPLQNCLRLTIGTEVEMHRVVRLLKKTMAQHKSRAIEINVIRN